MGFTRTSLYKLLTNVTYAGKVRYRDGVHPRPPPRTSPYMLLTNVAYAGKVRYKDEVHPSEHPVIFEADLWQRVQTLLGRNGRIGGAPVRTGSGRC